MQNWKQRVRQLKKETHTLYLACKDSRTPWYGKVLAAIVVAYALSPVDLIPDFIPILGYVDDLILLPLGIILVLRMIPPVVLEDCRKQAEVATDRDTPESRIAVVAIAAIWLLLGVLVVFRIGRILKR